jgi:hypothetical protein
MKRWACRYGERRGPRRTNGRCGEARSAQHAQEATGAADRRGAQRATLMVVQAPAATADSALQALTVCFAPPSAALALSAA